VEIPLLIQVLGRIKPSPEPAPGRLVPACGVLSQGNQGGLAAFIHL
jgi:hypothetical protein